MGRGTNSKAWKQNSANEQLGILVGNWSMVGTHPQFPTAVSGHSSFHWLEESALLAWHFDWDPELPPNAISVIGHDDSGAEYSVIYSDERGIARIYTMTLENRVWKMWRDAPGFSQRMTGKISDDGNTIVVHGELSRDGKNWEEDLGLTYTREKQ